MGSLDLNRKETVPLMRLLNNVILGFPGGSDGKESACHAGDLGLIPGLGRSPGEGHGNPFLFHEFHEQRSLVGYSPWGHNSHSFIGFKEAARL